MRSVTTARRTTANDEWAEQNGFLALEFTVTWAAAVALLDRAIPFTLTTVETQRRISRP